nr:hypothetical protein Hi04_10k_c5981_00022 [uncultured bacterium]
MFLSPRERLAEDIRVAKLDFFFKRDRDKCTIVTRQEGRRV